MTKLRAAVVVFLLGTVVVLAGCRESKQATNAQEFREKVQKVDYEVELDPEIEGRPGLVKGVATTDEGVSSRFIYAFGPAPEGLLPEPADGKPGVWVDAGDELYYWMEPYPTGLAATKVDRVLDMQFAIEDTACRVVSGEACEF